jgi:hypothetical protein
LRLSSLEAGDGTQKDTVDFPLEVRFRVLFDEYWYFFAAVASLPTAIFARTVLIWNGEAKLQAWLL